MSDKQETIEILVIKQDEKPIRKTIPNTLEAKQHEVGGYIEPFGLKTGRPSTATKKANSAGGHSTAQSAPTTSKTGLIQESWK